MCSTQLITRPVPIVDLFSGPGGLAEGRVALDGSCELLTMSTTSWPRRDSTNVAHSTYEGFRSHHLLVCAERLSVSRSV